MEIGNAILYLEWSILRMVNSLSMLQLKYGQPAHSYPIFLGAAFPQAESKVRSTAARAADSTFGHCLPNSLPSSLNVSDFVSTKARPASAKDWRRSSEIIFAFSFSIYLQMLAS
jgi:hypothetical protein